MDSRCSSPARFSASSVRCGSVGNTCHRPSAYGSKNDIPIRRALRTVPCWWPWRIWLSVTAFVPSLVADFVSSPLGSQWTSRNQYGWATGWKLRPIFSTNHGGMCSPTATWSVTVNGSFEPAASIRSWTTESLAARLSGGALEPVPLIDHSVAIHIAATEQSLLAIRTIPP